MLRKLLRREAEWTRRRKQAALEAVVMSVIWLVVELLAPSGPLAYPGLVTGLLPGITADATVSKPKPRTAGAVTTLCGMDLHLITRTGIDIRNNNFRGQPECIANRADAPGFVITKSGADTPDAAFPNAFAGCETSVCSPHSGMPIPVRDIRSLTSTWDFTPALRWKGDAAYDIWFDTGPRTRGQDNGAEIMIWMDTSHLGKPAGREVKINGALWRFNAHRARNSHGQSWNYLMFWKVTPRTGTDNLPLLPFIQYAGRYHHAVRPSWWLTSVEAGFELWSGGVGMSTDNFAVNLTSKPRS